MGSKTGLFLRVTFLFALGLALLGVLEASTAQNQHGPAVPSRIAIVGEVTSAEGKKVSALVTVRDVQKGIAVTLMTGSDGRFRIEDLFPGDYKIWARRKGFGPGSVSINGLSHDLTDLKIALKAGQDRQPLNNAEMLEYLPEGQAKQLIRFHCIQCHGLEYIVSQKKTPEQWEETVSIMAQRVPPPPEGQMELVAQYLGAHFGLENRAEVPEAGEPDFHFDPDGVLVEYDLPKRGVQPHGIAVDHAGNVWVADFDVRPATTHNSIFRIDPQRSAIRTYQIPIGGAGARSITIGRDNTVWVTLLFSGIIGKLDPATGNFTPYKIPTPNVWPHAFVFDAEGNGWFTGMMSDSIGEFIPKEQRFEQYQVPTPRSMLSDIVVDRNGALWYTGLFAHKLGHFSPKTKKFREFPTPSALSSTRDLMIDQKGNIWVTLFAAGKIAAFDPGAEKFTEYELPNRYAAPYDLVVANDAAVWVSDFNTNSIVYLDPKGKSAAQYSLVSGPYARPGEVALDESGRLWFCESGSGKVGFVERLPPGQRGVWRFGSAP